MSISNLLSHLFESNASLLQRLNLLVASGLESQHRATVSRFVKMWNQAFGVCENTRIPENVQDALLRLRPVANLKLPEFLEVKPDVSQIFSIVLVVPPLANRFIPCLHHSRPWQF